MQVSPDVPVARWRAWVWLALRPSAWAQMWRYRAHVLFRALIATIGGYYLAGASAALCARALIAASVSVNDARLAGTMLGFLVCALAAMWVFGCATWRRAMLGVALPALALWALVRWLQ